MNAWRWIARSLRHHARSHAAVVAGTALTGAVLTGALLTGDALHRRVRALALERVGRIHSVISRPGTFARAGLAAELAAESHSAVAPALLLPGALRLRQAGLAGVELGRVQVLGMDRRYLALGAAPASAGLAEALTGPTALLSAELARACRFDSGLPGPDDQPLLGLERASLVGVEMPLGEAAQARFAYRSVQPVGVLPDAVLGRFDLAATQIPPRNLFVPLDWVDREAGLEGWANLFVGEAEPDVLRQALTRVLQPSHLGLQIHAPGDSRTGPAWWIGSEQVYLPAGYVRALERTGPAAVLGLYHLVDGFRSVSNGTVRFTPYCFVAALTPTPDRRLVVVPAGMPADGIVISAWLAEALQVGPGDTLELLWRRFTAGGLLVPDQAVLRVVQVLAMTELAGTRAAMPEFPGLSDVERCSDWQIGLPLDADQLNDPANEHYWEAYGPTPKACLAFATGQRFFGTHFGEAMTARVAPETPPDVLDQALRAASPESLGFTLQPLRQQALQAAEQATDFRQLFLGMSLVLAGAALLLTGLVTGLGVAERRSEVGTLLACGMPLPRIRRLLFAELAMPVACGALLGCFAGVAEAQAVIWGLNRLWTGAIANTRVTADFGAGAFLTGLGATVAASALAVTVALRGWGRAQVLDLLSGTGRAMVGARGGRGWLRAMRWIAAGGGLTALWLLASPAPSGSPSGGRFFGAGAALLLALVCGVQLVVDRLGRHPSSRADGPEAGALARWASSPARAGLLNVLRRPARAFLLMLLLAGGSFLTVGIVAMKHDPAARATEPDGGGGGFAWLAEPPNPVTEAVGEAAIARALGVPVGASGALPVRVRPGDAAECLNLNRAQSPRVLGVPAARLAARGAFGGSAARAAWEALEQSTNGILPALTGDTTTALYGLQARLGPRDGTLFSYPGPTGAVVRLRTVAALPSRVSVLQGSLVVDGDAFARAFPQIGGYGLWLVPAPAGAAHGAGTLGALTRSGWEVTPVAARLRLLGRVESAYLDMFLVLGGLGMVLGAAGVGLVVLRNAAARRGELAVLRVFGLTPRQVRGHLLSEYLLLLAGGLVAGVVPAYVAVQPAVRALRHEVPLGSMVLLVAGIAATGVAATCWAAWRATRGDLTAMLRGE